MQLKSVQVVFLTKLSLVADSAYVELMLLLLYSAVLIFNLWFHVYVVILMAFKEKIANRSSLKLLF